MVHCLLFFWHKLKSHGALSNVTWLCFSLPHGYTHRDTHIYTYMKPLNYTHVTWPGGLIGHSQPNLVVGLVGGIVFHMSFVLGCE